MNILNPEVGYTPAAKTDVSRTLNRHGFVPPSEDKERRKKEAAIREAAQKDKNRKESEARDKAALDAENRIRKAHGLPPLDALPGGASYKKSGEKGSEATRKAIDDAIKRALPPAVPADKKVNEFKAQTLIVTQIKSQ